MTVDEFITQHLEAKYADGFQVMRVDDAEQLIRDAWATAEREAWTKARQEFRDLRRSWEAAVAEQKHKKGPAAIAGKWPGDETDEEINSALEQLS